MFTILFTSTVIISSSYSDLLTFTSIKSADLDWLDSSDVSEPRLGLARFWLELLAKKLGSARSVFQKARFTKNCKNELFYKIIVIQELTQILSDF